MILKLNNSRKNGTKLKFVMIFDGLQTNLAFRPKQHTKTFLDSKLQEKGLSKIYHVWHS